MRGFVCLLALVLAAACAPQDSGSPALEDDGASDDGNTLEEMREEAWGKIDIEACKAKGGEARPEGMLGLPRCVLPYGDAGEVCTDASDCEGRCLADDAITDFDGPDGAMKGLCEADDSPFGCYAEIERGALGAALCVD